MATQAISLSRLIIMLKLFLPSLVRGVYRYDQLIKNTDSEKFATTKLNFLPNEYKGFIGEKLKYNINLSSYILTLSEIGLSETLIAKKQQFFFIYKNYFKKWYNPKGENY